MASLMDRHPHFSSVPLEARFHAKPRGFPDLLAGRATRREFLRKLKRYWWRRIPAGQPLPSVLPGLPMGRKVLGLHRVVPRKRFESAVASFERGFEQEREAACRRLFYDLLWPIAEESDSPALVEMTTDNVMQGGTLGRLFPEAKFVLTVRDGRDTGASKVARRQRPHHPTDVGSGIDWWLERMMRVDAGLRELNPARVLVIGLDSFVTDEREATYERLLEFLSVRDRPRMRRFFDEEMSPEHAHRHRWRDGLSQFERETVNHRYERALERLEAEGSPCAALLRRSFEREG
jgi:Sulfotransferase family